MPQPDFIIIGVRRSDRVLLYASRDLSYIELTAIVDDSSLTFDRWIPPITLFELSLKLYRFVVIEGRTYAEAMQHLFTMGEPENWNPPPVGELGEGPRALTPPE